MSVNLLLGKITKLTNSSANLARKRCPAVGVGSVVSSISKVILFSSLPSSCACKGDNISSDQSSFILRFKQIQYRKVYVRVSFINWLSHIERENPILNQKLKHLDFSVSFLLCCPFLPGSANYFDTAMTKFIANNKTEALKTDTNLSFTMRNCQIVRSRPLTHRINYKFVCLSAYGQ